MEKSIKKPLSAAINIDIGNLSLNIQILSTQNVLNDMQENQNTKGCLPSGTQTPNGFFHLHQYDSTSAGQPLIYL